MGRTGSSCLRGGCEAHGGQYKYSGPYKVLVRGNKAWKLQVGERVDVVSRDRLKPHLRRVPPEAAVPPTRGRPRTVSVAPVASPSVAEKWGGLCNGRVL